MLSLQRKGEYHVAVAKKAKQMWDVETERIMYAVHAQNQFVWNVSKKLSKHYTMSFLQKKLIYYVNIMLMRHVNEY